MRCLASIILKCRDIEGDSNLNREYLLLRNNFNIVADAIENLGGDDENVKACLKLGLDYLLKPVAKL